METKKAKIALLTSMCIFGTIGIFRRYIPLPSSMIALLRGIIGTLFLLLFVIFTKQEISKESIKKNLLPLMISGAMIGFNWILLFEAYNYTSIATATLCYYMAPIIVILASPFLLHEKLTKKKAFTTIIAFIGMILVSGVYKENFALNEEIKGVVFGLGAAILYGSVVLMNKKIQNINGLEKTMIQIGTSAIVLLPYTLFTNEFVFNAFDTISILMILFVGIVHTGIAYALYFSTTKTLDAQTLALYSYIDPIVAILLSVLLLQETMSIFEIIGAVCILCATFYSEVSE